MTKAQKKMLLLSHLGEVKRLVREMGKDGDKGEGYAAAMKGVDAVLHWVNPSAKPDISNTAGRLAKNLVQSLECEVEKEKAKIGNWRGLRQVESQWCNEFPSIRGGLDFQLLCWVPYNEAWYNHSNAYITCRASMNEEVELRLTPRSGGIDGVVQCVKEIIENIVKSEGLNLEGVKT